MLIASPRHSVQDLSRWAEYEQADRIVGAEPRLERKAERSIEAIREFAAVERCYAGISWGKDSTVLAHLLWRAIPSLAYPIPCAWVCVLPIANPECGIVEESFLSRWRCDYRRFDVLCPRDRAGYHASGTLERGFRQVAEWAHADRHISGVRGDESSSRLLRMRRWGIATDRTCAPLGWWTAQDIYGYLAHYDLPVHPAYAMLGGGRWPRERLRVASLGGRRGDGNGRAEWEAEYYGDVLRRLQAR